MTHIRRCALGMLLLVPLPAFAQYDVGNLQWRDYGRLLNGVACNASSTARTFRLPSGTGAGFGIANVQITLTQSAATAVSMTCQSSITSGNPWADVQSCNVASGECTSSNASWTHPVTGSQTWPWRVDFLGASDFRCTVSCASGGGSDLLTVYVRASTF